MRIVLLSRSSSTYTTHRLSDVARGRGHHVRILDPLRCELLLDGQSAQVLYRRKPLPRFDLVIPRIAQSITGYGLAVLAQLSLRGAVPVNDAAAISQAHNKLRCLQALASHGIDVPRTVMAGDPVNLNELASLVGGVPVLVRLLSSGQRTGMMICETIESTKAALETVLGLGQNFILQRYVRARRGRDLRALVVGDRVIAAVRRRARPGRLAKSLTRGARFAEVTLSARQARIAVESARVVGLQVAAVDMLELDGKLRVFEVNASPGLREMEATTGLDLVTPIVELGERSILHGRGDRRGYRLAGS
jgi:ribosomal protein S6--L-glutamate ligase